MDMIKYTGWVFVLLVAIMPSGFAQENQQMAGGVITGKIFDAALPKPIEFANVILFNANDSVMVTGATTDARGNFQIGKIQHGNYYVDIQFIGYKKKRLANLEIGPAQLNLDLGKILLQQTALSLEGVEVQGEAMAMTYQLDKKVINVGQQQTAISGTAVDVLENVPSVNVDLEGNVSLRGSSNFTVLVDGRPSVLEPSEALQQIPAGAIENIEIITNPSAKHEAEGGTGIINIVLKKERREGRSGIANFNVGVGDKYGSDFLYDHKAGGFQANFGIDYNRRLFTGADREENRTSRAGLTSFIQSNGDSRRQDISLGLRSEIKIDLSRRDMLSFSVRYGNRNSVRGALLNYAERTEPATETEFYLSAADRDRKRNFFALASSYQHRFAPKGHELSAELFFRKRDGDETTTYNLLTNNAAMISGQRTTEAGPSDELRLKLDYSLTLGEKGKFETGYQSEMENSEDRTGLYEYESARSDYVLMPQFSNVTRYDENVHALYAIFAGEWKRLGVQAGLRGELTDRTIISQGAARRFTMDQWDYFPTLHLSHQFAVGQQAMASYTRRIDRPGGGELEPFLTWADAYNVSIGNPALKPEYIDSYELGYQANFGKSVWSVETYYRKARNKIEDVRSVYADNVTLHSAANIGADYALGSELLLNYDISKKWNAALTGNLYQYRIAGALFGEAFSRESFNWNARLSNTIKLGESIQLQLDGHYNSPTVSTQGRREGFFTANAAMKYEFIEKLLSATLQIRDVFGSAKNERISQGADFYSYNYSKREAPVVMLNLKYNFNNYKPERNSNREADDEENDN
jgi:outer membrane receptor protein involved in Fe transport